MPQAQRSSAGLSHSRGGKGKENEEGKSDGKRKILGE